MSEIIERYGKEGRKNPLGPVPPPDPVAPDNGSGDDFFPQSRSDGVDEAIARFGGRLTGGRGFSPRGILNATGIPSALGAAADTYTRAREGSLGFFTGDDPVESAIQAYQGVTGQKQFNDEDLGFARLMPEGSTSRRVSGDILGRLVDPITLATAGAGGAARLAEAGADVAGPLAREGARAAGFGEVGQTVADIAGSLGGGAAAVGAKKIASALDDNAVEAAIRKFEGPAERSLPGIGADGRRATDVPFRPKIVGAAEPPESVVSDLIIPGESPSIGLLRRYEGAVNTQGLEIRRDLDLGNRSLGAKGIGRATGQSRSVERTPEMEQLFKALHGEGEVPPALADEFASLKASVDAETAATVGFDPKFMPVPDYFPRGWKEVDVSPAKGGGGGFGSTPGFKKPRSEMTFSEILDTTFTRPDGSTYRLEPASWNPYEQLALRKVAGAEYREQTTLINRMKEMGVAVKADGPLPEGYRVPRVGPAFEGKPQIAPPDIDNAAPSFFGYTDRYAVPDNVANVLENMYGRNVNLGKPIEAVLNAGMIGKRAKLLGSLFQQADFSTRTGFASFGGAVDSLLAGKPVEAVAKVAKLPRDLGKIVAANLSPNRRALLRDEILSGKPMFPERPGVTLKGIAEGGWSQADISIVRRDVRSAIQQTVKGETLTQAARRNLGRLEAANQRGLFDGVYPQAQTIALKNWIVPRILRQHPEWTDEQIMGRAATEVNKAFSTLGDFQTVIKSPYLQHLTRNLIFSTNEAEALLRGAGSTFLGDNKRLWGSFYVGGALFLATVANLVHMASTALEGDPEPLPLARYNPLKKDDRSPVGINYNGKFLSPDTPLRGEGGRGILLDTVGQMDTALRVLDPLAFLTAREGVLVRAATNQVRGEDYYGNRIDTVGPKGVVSRAGTLASDLFEPIGVGQARGMFGLTGEQHEPVGAAGSAVQAAGLNLRTAPLGDIEAQKRFGKDYRDLTPSEKDALDQANPEQAALRSKERIARGGEFGKYEEVKQMAAAEQAEADKTISGPQAWKDDYHARQQRLFGAREALIGQGKADTSTPWGQYYEVLRLNTGPTGSVDWDAVEKWRAGLDESTNAAIDRETGVGGTPRVREYRKVGKDLDKTGYFALGDSIWASLQKRVTGKTKQEISAYDSYDEYRTDLVDGLAQRLMSRGMDKDVAVARAAQEVDSAPVVQAFSKQLQVERAKWVKANPDLAKRAIATGYISPSKTNLRSAGEPVGVSGGGGVPSLPSAPRLPALPRLQ